MDTAYIDRAIEAWIATKTRISGSAETHKSYAWVIGGFRTWLQASGRDLDPDLWAGEGEAARRRAIAFLASEAQKFAGRSKRHPTAGLSDSSYAQHLSALSSFYDFAVKRDFFDCINPISKIERPRIRPYNKVQPLNVAEVAASMQSIDRTTPRAIRDYALLAVLLQTGRRVSEVASLHWRNVELLGSLADLENIYDVRLALNFERIKGGKTARHELSSHVSRAILECVARFYEINPLYLDGARPLWTSWYDRARSLPLTTRSIAYICKKYLNTSKVHRLRHTFAAQLQELGLTLQEIQALLGHEDLATTAIYLPALRGVQNRKLEDMDRLLGIT